MFRSGVLLYLCSACALFLLPLPVTAAKAAPIGEVTLAWQATCKVTTQSHIHYLLSEHYAFAPGDSDNKYTDAVTITYSGRYRWLLYDDTAIPLNSKDGTGDISVTCTGGGTHKLVDHWTGYHVEPDKPAHDEKCTAITNGGWRYTITPDPDIIPPYVYLYYLDGKCHFVFPKFFTLKQGKAKGSETCVTTNEDGTRSSTEALNGGDALVYAEMAISEMANDDEWNKQLDCTYKTDQKSITCTGKALWSSAMTRHNGKETYTINGKELWVEKDAEPANNPGEKAGDYAEDADMHANITVNYTLGFSRTPSKLEAVILPPDDYAEWLPEADIDEDTPGNTLSVNVALRVKDQPEKTPLETARFQFELCDTTKEKGVCLNAPPLKEAKESVDLKFTSEENPDLTLGNDGQTAESKPELRASAATVTCYDWGAFTTLKVTAFTSDGQTLVAYVDGKPKATKLTIPFDENQNRIADAWEKANKLTNEEKNADWDGATIPKAQQKPGDGIALYEKYRGFEFSTDHERLDPHQKYLFVYDPDSIVRYASSQPSVAEMNMRQTSGLVLRYIDDDEHWSGAGSLSDGKRIVNFNAGDWGHATEQTALHVTTSEACGDVPPGWQAMMANYGIAGTDSPGYYEGFTFPDFSNTFGSPMNTYQIIVSNEAITANIRIHAHSHMQHRPEYLKVKKDIADWMNAPHSYDDAHPGHGEAKSAWLVEYDRRCAVLMDMDLHKLDQWVDEYIAAHPDAWHERVLKETALVVTHELGHGVGVKHHEPKDEGNAHCAIRYPSPPFKDGCTMNPADPLDLKIHIPWPDKFCKDAAGSADPQGCWGQIVVTDRQGE